MVFLNGVFHEPIMAICKFNELDNGCLCWEEGGVASLAMSMTLVMSGHGQARYVQLVVREHYWVGAILGMLLC